MSARKFDFNDFSISAIKTIDSIRSKGTTGSVDPVESRINAFYRAIGLPSVSIADSFGQQEESSVLLDSNGNYFEPGQFTVTEVQRNAIVVRRLSYLSNIDNEKINNFLDYNRDEINSSISTKQGKKRKRGTLFPMLVDADTVIWPIDRRVGQAFSLTFELTRDRVVYYRPLIETILSIKLKGQGIFNTQEQSRVSLTLTQTLEVISKDIQDLLEDMKYYIGDVMQQTVDSVGRARRMTGLNVKPAIYSIPQENPITLSGGTRTGELDTQLLNQQNELSKKESRLAIFDFEDVVSARDTSKNIQVSLLSNNILNIIVNDSDIKKGIKETEYRLEKQERVIKQAYKNMELLLGSYSGISGTDILSVIIAMFTVEVDVLVGLLNPVGKRRLKRQTGYTSNAYSAVNAVGKLEEKVGEIIDSINEEALKINYNEKMTKKKRMGV